MIKVGGQNLMVSNKAQGKQGGITDKQGPNSDKQGSINGKQDNKDKDTIFGGNLNLGQNDLLGKKEQMKKNAMQVILDAFANDTKLDENVEEHMDKVTALSKEASEASGEINNMRDLKQKLQETYSVDAASDEQKDLELLEKSKDISKGLSDSSLTKEEQERVKNMGPLTEYQQAALNYHDMEQTWRKKLTIANDNIANEHRTINAIELGRVKKHPIVDAKKESDKMMDAAGKQLISGLVGEAKDTIDDKIGDDSDKAQEVKEKNKKEEEAAKATDKKSDAKKTKQTNNTPVPTAETVDRDIDWEKIQQEAKASVEKANLLMEDLKGLTVDEQV
jgi:hypothetical protein